MRLALLLGVALGLAAILLAWTRTADRSRAGDARPPVTVASAAPAAAASPLPAGGGELETLRARSLEVPVEGVHPRDLRESFSEARNGHLHEALDIPAPRGTAVRASDDGFVAKLFTSARGGLTVYQFDPTQTWCYYYAHLDRYAPGLHEGQPLHRDQVIGFVGTSGNAPPQTPHLHFAIFRLGPEKRWWQGTAVDPFVVWAERQQAR